MKRLLVIENDPMDPLGYLGEAVEAAGFATDVISPPTGDAVPPTEGYAGVIVLGGPQGAYEADVHPYLEDEMRLIRSAVAVDLPVLGICLGSQLIAQALGGRAYKAERPEAGVITPQLTEEGSADPLAALISRPMVTFHQDTFEIPPQGTLLAQSDRFPQAFRCGSALAVQPHPEASADTVAVWVHESDVPERAGADGAGLIADMRTTIDPGDALGLFAAWLEEVASV